ncbi:hypothetical protein F511_18811 [Dorcoceras hygrometricum]|uniref:Uncharacterized protein n=1 Tax=Dorcoceras hygrometricum TaxID=472368 RepID=A0A2Z7CTZ8_9LAMI|nr:hypothetical protein F511_18811 [Dorcoceras hygrometricum]
MGTQLNVLSTRRGFWEVRLPKNYYILTLTLSVIAAPPSSPNAAAAARCRRKFVSGQLDEENPFMQNSSVLLVQPDEGVLVLVVDRIGDYLPQSTEKSRVLVIPVGARHKCQQGPRDRFSLSLHLLKYVPSWWHLIFYILSRFPQTTPIDITKLSSAEICYEINRSRDLYSGGMFLGTIYLGSPRTTEKSQRMSKIFPAKPL